MITKRIEDLLDELEQFMKRTVFPILNGRVIDAKTLENWITQQRTQTEYCDDIQLVIGEKKAFQFHKRKWRLWMKVDGIWCLNEDYTGYYQQDENLPKLLEKLQQLTDDYLNPKQHKLNFHFAKLENFECEEIINCLEDTIEQISDPEKRSKLLNAKFYENRKAFLEQIKQKIRNVIE